jgi:hypothetical protein
MFHGSKAPLSLSVMLWGKKLWIIVNDVLIGAIQAAFSSKKLNSIGFRGLFE